jgi:hypothetical protein
VTKLLFLILVFMVLLSACGQKSVIKNDVEARRTREAYGDGKYTIVPIIVPLSDKSISAFESPLKNMDFVRGFAKMFYDMGAKMGLGKAQLTLIQPIPNLPDKMVHGLRIKRLFFYIEPHVDCGDDKDLLESCSYRPHYSWLRRLFSGVSNIDFKFLDKIAVKASTRPMQNVTEWTPIVSEKDLSRRDFSPLQKLFRQDEIINNERSRELVLLKYSKKTKQKDTNQLKPTYIVYVKKGKSPAETKNFLKEYPKFKNYFKRIHLMNQSLLVELVDDPIVKESVESIIADSAQEIDDMGIEQIEECNEKICLDFKVPSVNLIPLISKSNGVQIDTYIDVGKVPNNFQLKGFIEFELQLDLPF